MTQEQIEQAAKEYAAEKCKYTFVKCDTCPWRGEAYCKKDASISAFIAGAESRQAEIDEMNKELDIVHSCLTDLFERQYSNEGERTCRIQSCLSEIEKLKKQSK